MASILVRWVGFGWGMRLMYLGDSRLLPDPIATLISMFIRALNVLSYCYNIASYRLLQNPSTS